MRLRVQLPAKAGSFRISNCEAEKVLTLPNEAFQIFLDRPEANESMITKYDYRQEDSDRVYCGVLVLGEDRTDGVLVYDRGRHFAYLPGARAVVDSILEEAVEKIVREGTENTNDGNWCYYFSELYERMGLIVEEGNGLDSMLFQMLEQRTEVAAVSMTDDYFDVCCHLDYCKNLVRNPPLPSTMSDRGSVLYQVVERGHTAAFVCERGGRIPDLCDLLEQASAIAEDGGDFAEALPRAAVEGGSWLRPALADEAEALSHDLGHGGAADQRVVIDLDDHRIRLEYDRRADSFQECLEALKERFPSATSGKLQSRLVSYLAEHDGSEELYQLLHQELGLTNQEIGAIGFALKHRYEPDASDAYQDIVDYIQFKQETSVVWAWAVTGNEMLTDERTLREIASRLAGAGDWDTESIYEELSETFGTNPVLLPDQGPELKL